MSGSGLIYAAIAMLWAAVLIPMWLRNHDTASENRSAERFGQAMRVLSRKEQRGRRAWRADPQHDQAPTTLRRRRLLPTSAASRHRARQSSRPVTGDPSSAPARRRPEPRDVSTALGPASRSHPRCLVGLTAADDLAASCIAGSLVGRRSRWRPWWCAFVVHLRVQAIQHERRRTRVGVRCGRTSASRGRLRRAEPATSRSRAGEERDRRLASSPVPREAVVVETKGVDGSDVTFDTRGDDWTATRPGAPTHFRSPPTSPPPRRSVRSRSSTSRPQAPGARDGCSTTTSPTRTCSLPRSPTTSWTPCSRRRRAAAATARGTTRRAGARRRRLAPAPWRAGVGMAPIRTRAVRCYPRRRPASTVNLAAAQGLWRSPVAHLVRNEGVRGSNPLSSTPTHPPPLWFAKNDAVTRTHATISASMLWMTQAADNDLDISSAADNQGARRRAHAGSSVPPPPSMTGAAHLSGRSDRLAAATGG